MPDGQNGVLEILNRAVNVDRIDVDRLTGIASVGPLLRYERPAYEIENYKWGNGTRGTSGGTITWAVVTSGQAYPSRADYTSQASGISAVFMPTIRQAFARWDEVGNFAFVETSSPLTADITLIFDELSGVGANTIGLANTYYAGTVIRNSYISFDINRRYRLLDGTVQTVGTAPVGSTSDFYTLVLHEIGHALGLDHEDDFDTVMNSAQDPNITDLTSDEIAAIRVIYGTGTTTPTEDDYPASAATTASIAIGGTATGRIDNSTDEDWFRVALTAGTSYRIDVRGNDSGGGTLIDPYVRLLTSSGTVLTADDDSGTGTDSQILYTVTTTGTYYIAASGFEGVQGTYTVAITTTSTGDDYAATSATTGAIAVGGSVTGRLETGTDADWFAITMTAGQTYRIDVRGAPSGGGTLADPFARVRTPTGVILASDNDTGVGLDAQLTYTAAFTGVHYIEAASGGAGTGTYTVSVASVPPADDFAAGLATTGALAVGGSVAGRIETAGDQDWVRVTLAAGVLYRFDGRGAPSGAGTLADPLMSLLNASGAVIATDNNSGAGADARILYTAPVSGSYYIAMRAASAAATGTYAISAAANPDDFAASTATTGTVAPGSIAEGVVETAGDRDWFRATLNANTLYNIEVRGTAAGSGVRWTQSSLVIRDSTGAAIASDTRGGIGAAARLSFAPAATGTYFIDALAYGAGVGSYEVSVSPSTALQLPSAMQDDGLSAAEIAALTAPPAFTLSDHAPQIAAAAPFPPSPFAALLAAADLPAEDRHRLEAADLIHRRELWQSSNPFPLPLV